jgi:MFS family permease
LSPASAPLDRGRRRLTLVAMCIGQGMILLDNTIVNVALPAIQKGLGVTPGALEWTVNAYVLALTSLILVGARSVTATAASGST